MLLTLKVNNLLSYNKIYKYSRLQKKSKGELTPLTSTSFDIKFAAF